MRDGGTCLLGRDDIIDLLTLQECIAAVERAFRLYGENRAATPGMLGMHGRDGAFHIKAGFLDSKRSYFAAKVNANYPKNLEQFGLPTIQGAILLCDAENGRPLAVMDSMEITARRTAAASAVAAKYLARPDAAVLTVCGCGVQGLAQIRALGTVLPLRKVFVYDADPNRSQKYVQQLEAEIGIEVRAAGDLRKAVGESDVCVTCTTSRRPVLHQDEVPPGMFVAAVGADHPEKQEIAPALMAMAKVVTDVTAQCAEIGDLHHAIAAGAMQLGEVHAELGEIVAGRKPGRTSASERVVFDSTGMALQDVAAAASVYEKAIAAGRGLSFNFAA